MADIRDPGDIDTLVEHFYTRVLRDPIIGFVFTDIAAIDLAEHLPRISAFWQWQLLGRPGYAGRPFEVHQEIDRRVTLTEHHFHRWLYLFRGSVDDLFQGPTAEAAKRRAERIADSMHSALRDRDQREEWRRREAQGVQLFTPAAMA